MKRLRATDRPKPRQQRPTYSEGAAGALGLYLGLVLSIFAAFAAGLYWLLQPAVNHNPGVAAYKPPPATILASAPARPPGQMIAPVLELAAAKVAAPAAAAPSQAPPDATPVPVPTARPADLAQVNADAVAEVKKKKKRKVAKRRRWRDPMSDYAAQYGGRRYDDDFRPWRSREAGGRRGGYRPWF